MSVKKKNKPVNSECETCTHLEGRCPVKDLDCLDCGKTSHLSRSRTCQKKKELKTSEKLKEKENKLTWTRKVKEQESDSSNTDSEASYRVREISMEETNWGPQGHVS